LPGRPVPETVLIRRARPEDGPALIAAIVQIDAETEFLGVPGQPHPWAERPQEELRRLAANERGAVFLALDQAGTIIGYLGAFAGAFTRTRGAVFIAVVGLRERWRGQGIGTGLFEAIEDWARARGAWRLELRVSSLNERGLALYRKRGFAIEGCIRGGVWRRDAWTDDFWMGKLLDPVPPDPAPEFAAEPPRARVELRALDGVAIRPLRRGDGAALRAWETGMVRSSRFALKSPNEVSSIEAIEADIADAAQDPHCWIAAAIPTRRAGDRFLGFASANIERGYRMEHDAFVNVGVLPEWSGQGLGRRLHDAVETWAGGQGVRRLTAVLQAPNRAGRAFAVAHGYAEEVVQRRYARFDGRLVDRVRLGKLLAE
jgi:RimJ/RimL family protein N-acetyltransferase